MKILIFLFSFFALSWCNEKIEILEIKEEIPISKNIDLYKVKTQLKPKNLKGISQNQIDQHWSLYEGYVSQVNQLDNELKKLREQGKGNSQNYADRRRRYGFEYNGMILHELYFENMANIKQETISKDLKKQLEKTFGSLEKWRQDFKNCGTTRGIGWVILYLDPQNKNLINAFIDDHEIGTISNFKPLLVMDVWEHAYMVDHNVKGRPDYIDSFFNNINWPIVNQRFKNAQK
jgi:superoxide dismutase, Fe-Mn family